MRQHVDQRHTAMTFVIVVARCPVRAVRQCQIDRTVVEQRGQRILVRLRQRNKIDKRLDQRADRTACLQRAIETRIVRIATADQRLYLAITRASDNHRTLQLRLLLAESVQRLRQRRFGQRLRRRRQRGVDGKARALQQRSWIIALQLRAHQIQECRRAIARQAGRIRHIQRCGPCRLPPGRIDQSGFVELIEHAIAPRQRQSRMSTRIVQTRATHQPDQQSDVGIVKMAYIAAKIEFGRRCESMHRLIALLAEKHLVDIGLQDAVLVVMRLDQ